MRRWLPKIYIIILNYNSWQDAIECIESFKLSGFQDFQIILLDNKSPNNSEDKIREFLDGKSGCERKNNSFQIQKKTILPYVFYSAGEAKITRDSAQEHRAAQQINEIESPFKFPVLFVQAGRNLGFASGNNIALQFLMNEENLSDSQKIFLLNPDTRIEKNTLRELNKETKTYFVSGCAIYDYHNPSAFKFYGAYRFLKPFGILKAVTNIADKSKIDYIYGGALCTTLGTFRKIGLLPTDYFLYWEETDWSYKAKKAGIELTTNEKAIVFDKVGTSTGRGYLAHYYFIRNSYLFYEKYFKWYLPTLFLFNGLRYLNKIKKRDYKSAKAIIDGTRDYFKGKKGYTPIG
ncbi:MAG TPA: glycosyltransferase family 2 protein [Aequorivita sp.]|nr:glycosyltransferase family 2 protein [Aequorivita sp.]